jgi:hypothetical protein
MDEAWEPSNKATIFGYLEALGRKIILHSTIIYNQPDKLYACT